MSNVNIHTVQSLPFMNFSRFSGGRLFSTCARARALDGDMQEPRAHVAVPRDVSPRVGPERHVAGAPARLRLRVLRGLVHQRAEVVVHRQHRDDARRSKTFPGVTVRVGLAFDASRVAGDDSDSEGGPGLILALHWQRHVYTVTGVLHRDGRFPLNPL